MRKRDKWYIFFKSTCVALWSVNGGYRVGSKLMEVGVSFEGIQMLTSHMTHHPSESHRGQLYALPFSPQNWRQFSYNSFLPSCFPMTPYKERSIWQILAGNEWPSWALKQLIEAQLQGRGAKTQNFPDSNFLRAKTFQTKCVKLFLTTSLKSVLLPLTTLPTNA